MLICIFPNPNLCLSLSLPSTFLPLSLCLFLYVSVICWKPTNHRLDTCLSTSLVENLPTFVFRPALQGPNLLIGTAHTPQTPDWLGGTHGVDWHPKCFVIPAQTDRPSMGTHQCQSSNQLVQRVIFEGWQPTNICLLISTARPQPPDRHCSYPQTLDWLGGTPSSIPPNTRLVWWHSSWCKPTSQMFCFSCSNWQTINGHSSVSKWFNSYLPINQFRGWFSTANICWFGHRKWLATDLWLLAPSPRWGFSLYWK